MYISQIEPVQRLRVFVAFWIFTKKKTLLLLAGKHNTIHAYKNLYLHCGPSTKVPSKLKSIDENENS